MSDAESRHEDAKREDWEDKHPMPEVDCGQCGERTWRLTQRYMYGDDADGNRGVPMELYECACGNEMEEVA